MGIRLRSLMEWGALGCGILLAGVAMQGWRIDGGSVRPGAAVTMYVDSSPTLAIDPSGLLFTRSWLRPAGLGPERAFAARNATGGSLLVHVRASGDTTDLDRVLAVRVLVGARTLFEGPLALLRARGSQSFLLPSHATRSVSLRAWIPASVRDGYEARAETVHVELATKAVAA
jgi:hypothetical protein